MRSGLFSSTKSFADVNLVITDFPYTVILEVCISNVFVMGVAFSNNLESVKCKIILFRANQERTRQPSSRVL